MALSHHAIDRRSILQMAPDTDTEREESGSRERGGRSGRGEHHTHTKAERITAVMIFVGVVWFLGWIGMRILLHFFP